MGQIFAQAGQGLTVMLGIAIVREAEHYRGVLARLREDLARMQSNADT